MCNVYLYIYVMYTRCTLVNGSISYNRGIVQLAEHLGSYLNRIALSCTGKCKMHARVSYLYKPCASCSCFSVRRRSPRRSNSGLHRACKDRLVHVWPTWVLALLICSWFLSWYFGACPHPNILNCYTFHPKCKSLKTYVSLVMGIHTTLKMSLACYTRRPPEQTSLWVNLLKQAFAIAPFDWLTSLMA